MSRFPGKEARHGTHLNVDESYPDSAPVLFTRNIAGNDLIDLTGWVLVTMRDDPPFGKRGAAVILKNGSGLLLRRYDKRQWEDIMGGHVTLTNRILRP